MSGSDPPKNAQTRGLTGRRAELTVARRNYRTPFVSQACFAAWRREAARLFAEYWFTGNERHLRAFYVHVIGMRSYQPRQSR